MKAQILSTDYFTVELESMLGDIDRRMLIELYQPLIGQNAVALFMTLWSYHDLDLFTQPSPHEFLFTLMHSDGNLFNRARRALEAVGLIKTLQEKQEQFSYYTYILYAPKSPDQFFDDVVFSGLFKKYLGEKQAQKIAMRYEKKAITDRAIDISASFGEVFHDDYDLTLTPIIEGNLSGRNQAGINKAFDEGLFLTELRMNTLINPKFLKDEDMELITQYASLYGVDELAMAIILSESISPDKHLIDFEKVRKKAQMESRYPFLNRKTQGKQDMTSQTNLAKKINMMDTLDPKNYLRLRQGNKPVAAVDLDLIERLVTQLKLPYPCINAVIDYTLTTKNNTLSGKYVEKIAASVLREGLSSALETMEYLKRTHYRGKKSVEPVVIGEPAAKTAEPSEDGTEISKMLEAFERKKKEKNK